MKIGKKLVLEVEYSDLEKTVTTFLKSKGYKNPFFLEYGYEVTVMEEWDNDSQHFFNDVSPKVDEYLIQTIKNNKDLYNDLSSILNLMCYEKVIEPGNYLIKVSW